MSEQRVPHEAVAEHKNEINRPPTTEEQAMLDAMFAGDSGIASLFAVKSRFGALSRHLTPEDRRRYDAVMDRVRAEEFPDDDSSLRGNFVFLKNHSDGLMLDYPAELNMDAANESIHRHHLGEILTQTVRKEGLKLGSERYESEEFKQAYSGLVKSRPLYKVLDALTKDDDGKAEQRPLRQHELAVRQAQIEEGVKQRYAPVLVPGESLTASTAARSELAKQSFQLDSETVLDKKGKIDNPTDRVQNWIKAELTEYLASDVARFLDKGDAVIHAHGQILTDGKVGIMYSSARGIGSVLGEPGIDSFSQYVTRKYNGKPIYQGGDFDKHVIGDFVREFYSPANVAVPPAVSLEKAVQKPFEDGQSRPAHLQYGKAQNRRFIIALKRPSGVVTTHEQQQRMKDNPDTIRASRVSHADVISLEDYIESARSPIGEVVERPEGPDVQRLIIDQQRQKLDQVRRRPDMVLDLPIYQGTPDRQPLIPGWETIGVDGSSWSFTKLEEDPYAGAANVPLTSAAKLVESWRNLGLTSMADRLAATDNPTLFDIQQIVSQEGRYTFDTDLLDESGTQQPESISDMAGWVRDGRLQAQCTGGNVFTAMSIQLAIEGSETSVISGFVLSPTSKTINQARHANTVVTVGGLQYVVDGTPVELSNRADAETLRAADLDGVEAADSHPQRSSMSAQQHQRMLSETERKVLQDGDKVRADFQIPMENEAEQLMTLEDYAQQVHEENKGERRARAANKLFSVLRGTYNAPSEEKLLEVIAGLPQADPVRRVVSFALRNTVDPGADAVAVADLEGYIGLIAAAQPADLQKLKLRKYPEAVVDTLRVTIPDLE